MALGVSGPLERWERWSGNLAILGGNSVNQHTLLFTYRILNPVLGKKQRTCLLFSLCPTWSPCQHRNRELYPCAPSPALSLASKSHSALLCPQPGGPSPLGCCRDGLNKTSPSEMGVQGGHCPAPPALLFPLPPLCFLLWFTRSLCSAESQS